MSKKLEELREKIDGIDEKIVKLYRERMDVTKDIAAYKKEKELPVLDAGRERAVLAKIGQLAGDDLADYAQSVYRTVMATTRSYQNWDLRQHPRDARLDAEALPAAPDGSLPGHRGRKLADSLRQPLQSADDSLLQHL